MQLSAECPQCGEIYNKEEWHNNSLNAFGLSVLTKTLDDVWLEGSGNVDLFCMNCEKRVYIEKDNIFSVDDTKFKYYLKKEGVS